MQPLIIVVFIAIAVVAMILGYLSALKRRQAMMAVATKLGLRISPGDTSFWISFAEATIATPTISCPAATRAMT